jgi:hypothetical protein
VDSHRLRKPLRCIHGRSAYMRLAQLGKRN